MSYYTQFEFKAKLVDDYPEILDKVVNHMDEMWREYYNGEDPPVLSSVYERPDMEIDHPFGKTVRWYVLFQGSILRNNELSICTDINYGYEEIQLFIDWIKPYVRGRKKKIYLGKWKGEDSHTWIYEYKYNETI